MNLEFESIQEFIAEYVGNVSRSGAFIRTEDPLPVGTRVHLRFSIILEDIETIEGEGEVVRTIEPGGDETPGMGVVFIELTDYSKDLLERLMVPR